MIVKFRNSYGSERELGRVQTEQEVNKIINQFLEDHNYKSYYWQIHLTEDGVKVIDVGSWSEFFYIYLEEGETWNEINRCR